MPVALIGGTGLDEFSGLTSGRPQRVDTKHGSVELFACTPGGVEMLFLPRHGPSHITPPHLINHRAHIAALRLLGVERAIGVCAVGSLTRDLQPGDIVVLTDFVDFTKGPPATFAQEIGDGVIHTDFTQPYCPSLSRGLSEACRELGVGAGSPATYLGVSGPRYETPSEVRLYASWGAHVVGMTNTHECILAREAGICYGAISFVTNLGTGLSADPVDHDRVRVLISGANSAIVEVVCQAFESVPDCPACICRANAGKIAFG
jgi:5'-methylthioadenosine phosphorylase